MKTKFQYACSVMAVAGGLFSGAAHATLTGLSCSTTDVSVTSVAQYSDTSSSAKLGKPQEANISSAACLGAYVGNDAFYPTTNLGYAGDGILNGGTQAKTGEILFPNPPGAFVTPTYPLHDLDGDGQVNDPGWIMLGKFEPLFEGGPFVFSPNAVGGDSSIVLSTFFSATITGAGVGTWAFTPDATVAQRASAMLGKNYFDQFALVFKAGDEFAVYDFTAAQFGVAHPSAEEPILNFFGTYDTRTTLRAGGADGCKNPAGLSHISIWVRDPGPGGSVPEPATLVLFGIAALGVAAVRKYKA